MVIVCNSIAECQDYDPLGLRPPTAVERAQIMGFGLLYTKEQLDGIDQRLLHDMVGNSFHPRCVAAALEGRPGERSLRSVLLGTRVPERAVIAPVEGTALFQRLRVAKVRRLAALTEVAGATTAQQKEAEALQSRCYARLAGEVAVPAVLAFLDLRDLPARVPPPLVAVAINAVAIGGGGRGSVAPVVGMTRALACAVGVEAEDPAPGGPADSLDGEEVTVRAIGHLHSPCQRWMPSARVVPAINVDHEFLGLALTFLQALKGTLYATLDSAARQQWIGEAQVAVTKMSGTDRALAVLTRVREGHRLNARGYDLGALVLPGDISGSNGNRQVRIASHNHGKPYFLPPRQRDGDIAVIFRQRRGYRLALQPDTREASWRLPDPTVCHHHPHVTVGCLNPGPPDKWGPVAPIICEGAKNTAGWPDGLVVAMFCPVLGVKGYGIPPGKRVGASARQLSAPDLTTQAAVLAEVIRGLPRAIGAPAITDPYQIPVTDATAVEHWDEVLPRAVLLLVLAIEGPDGVQVWKAKADPVAPSSDGRAPPVYVAAVRIEEPGPRFGRGGFFPLFFADSTDNNHEEASAFYRSITTRDGATQQFQLLHTLRRPEPGGLGRPPE